MSVLIKDIDNLEQVIDNDTITINDGKLVAKQTDVEIPTFTSPLLFIDSGVGYLPFTPAQGIITSLFSTGSSPNIFLWNEIGSTSNRVFIPAGTNNSGDKTDVFGTSSVQANCFRLDNVTVARWDIVIPQGYKTTELDFYVSTSASSSATARLTAIAGASNLPSSSHSYLVRTGSLGSYNYYEDFTIASSGTTTCTLSLTSAGIDGITGDKNKFLSVFATSETAPATTFLNAGGGIVKLTAI